MQILIFIIIIAIAIGELILSGRWHPTYFKTGITIYKRTMKSNNYLKPLPDAEHIQSGLPNSIGPDILIRKLENNLFAFRERAFQFTWFSYTPIMHGNLEFNPKSSEVIVRGRLNWFIVAFSITFVTLPITLSKGEPEVLLLPTFLFIVLGILYAIQAIKFNKIAGVATDAWARRSV